MALGTDWLDSSFGNISSSHGQYSIQRGCAKEKADCREYAVQSALAHHTDICGWDDRIEQVGRKLYFLLRFNRFVLLLVIFKLATAFAGNRAAVQFTQVGNDIDEGQPVI
jgi:hypothetical protein